jgi:hypothetical protein
MSSTARDMVEGYERIARQIQQFVWEEKPFKSNKKEHTKEELEKLLEDIRKTCWSNYDSGAYDLGWKD